jgi:hypothetical protein
MNNYFFNVLDILYKMDKKDEMYNAITNMLSFTYFLGIIMFFYYFIFCDCCCCDCIKKSD